MLYIFSFFLLYAVLILFFGEGSGTLLQYSCLENPMDGGAWQAAVHGVTKSRTQLSDFTFTFHFSLSCIAEGNGNPLQCSCLENPRDGGAWWAAVYGITQCRTRLMRFSTHAHTWLYKPDTRRHPGHFPPFLQEIQFILLLSHFSRVRLCATPYTAAHQAPPSLGFSRQEHWSGLPFPSPTHESEK